MEGRDTYCAAKRGGSVFGFRKGRIYVNNVDSVLSCVRCEKECVYALDTCVFARGRHRTAQREVVIALEKGVCLHYNVCVCALEQHHTAQRGRAW